VCTGTIHYPRDVRFPSGTSRTGRLVVMKAALTAKLPYQLLAYASSNAVFPRDSTSDQWFDHRQFDVYQQLGRYLGARAADAAGQPAARAARDGQRGIADDHLKQVVMTGPDRGQRAASASARMARRRQVRQRARVGPMLPIGVSRISLTSA
jgi:hypothetical protein